ncbi:hypothetical protein QW180_07770 [Vibrio sinaloensis]|nr:hypothetical protein [Vibrio sinaloensis]
MFRFDGRLMVKRIQFLPNGIKVVSDNLSYDPWELSKKRDSKCRFLKSLVKWFGLDKDCRYKKEPSGSFLLYIKRII